MSPSEATQVPGANKTHAPAKDNNIPERHDSKVNDDAGVVAASAQAVPGAPSTQDRRTVAEHGRPLLDTLMVDSNRIRPHSPASAGLHLETNIIPPSTTTPNIRSAPIIFETPVETDIRPLIASPTALTAMGSSLRSTLSSNSIASSLSPGSTASALTSPYLAAMADITPLPSPVMGSEQSGFWRRPRVGSGLSSKPLTLDDASRPARAASISCVPANTSPRKKKAYGNLIPTAMGAALASIAIQKDEQGQPQQSHGRNRSISDFVPETLYNPRPRHVTMGASDSTAAEYHMHREAHLAAQRGLIAGDPSKALPSPPASNTSVAEDEDAEDEEVFLESGEPAEFLYIHCGIHHRRRKFRQLRHLGQGTFSKVMLATNERVPAHLHTDIEKQLDPHRLVAVKIVEHGPAGGADEERIEISLRREVDMLKSVSHPSLIHLKACEDQLTRTLLVLTYCPGGDLFELASEKRDILTPKLIQRMFAELVDAVRYLHKHWIVHRDIKLENVLVNLPPERIRDIEDPISFPTPLITLSDLGLSRRIPQPPESPLLSTRCGSEDYAAPEILLGQPYDGRLTDGWALGVVLYALMEGRLPFDAPPGKPDRSRNTHRIARCDWIWCRFGDDSGDWEDQRGVEFQGARYCVEALLKKVRMGRKPLEDIEQMPWVQQGIQVSGGLQMREEDSSDL